MASKTATVAAAVATLLGNVTPPAGVTIVADWQYFPSLDRDEMEAGKLYVTVSPHSTEVEQANRGQKFWDVTLSVGVQAAIASDDRDAIDPYIEAAESLVAAFRPGGVLSNGAIWRSAAPDPAAFPLHLHLKTLAVATNLLTVVYRITE